MKMKMLDAESLKVDLERLNKFLNMELVSKIRIRDLPVHLLDKEEFKKEIRKRGVSKAEMKRIRERLRKRIKRISQLREKVIKMPLQELKNGKINRALLAELAIAREVERNAPLVKEVLTLLIEEENLREKLAKVREKFSEI